MAGVTGCSSKYIYITIDGDVDYTDYVPSSPFSSSNPSSFSQAQYASWYVNMEARKPLRTGAV